MAKREAPERRGRDSWQEAIEKGLAANDYARHIVDQIISGKRRKPISQEAVLQIAARLSQCLAAELQAFADLQRILMTMANEQPPVEEEDES